MAILRRKVFIVVILLMIPASAVRADYISDTLGPAGPGNYAVLALSGATDIALNGPGTTNGNVGISSPASGTANLQLNSTNNAPISNTAIAGNLYLGNNATVNNTSQVQGTVFTNQNSVLSAANTAAVNASKTFAGLTPTQTVAGGAINGSTTITGGAGLNVINVSGINIGNGQALTINAPKGSQFVINDSGNMVLNSGQVKLTGGIAASSVVFNLTGGNGGNNLQTSGGLNNESVINGIVLDPNGSVAMAPGLINGELIAGGPSIHLVSGASVNASPPTPSVPEPASIILMGLGGLGMAEMMRRKSKTSKVAEAGA